MAALKSINEFISQKNIAVAGVSRKKQKFGNSIFTELTKKGYNVYPVNPHLDEYDGKKCYKEIASLPKEVSAIVINTKPATSKVLVEEAELKGIKNIWLQQGSADKDTIALSNQSNSNIITKECIIMYAEPVKGFHKFHRWLKKSFGNYPR